MRYFILILVLMTFPTFAKNSQNQAKMYGFDWLQPKSAQCVAVSKKLQKRLAFCDQGPGFGMHKPIKSCKVGEMSEWIIYATQRQCRDELEIMKSNEP